MSDAQATTWEKPDKEAVIRDNPLLEYCQARGWQLRRDGSANRYKCLCPLHDERTPSFKINVGKNTFHCFGCGRKGNVIDLHMALKGVPYMEALCDLAEIEYHGGKKANSSSWAQKKNNTAKPQSGNKEPYDPLKDKVKARQRESWTVFEVPTQAEIKAIAELRGLSPEGITLAHERGLLFTADYKEQRAWIITDSQRVNAQARRLDGQEWIINGEAEKTWSLLGSIGDWPIGLREALAFPNIALVEGGPDLLAAFHLAWCATSTPETLALGKGIDVIGSLGIVAMLGTFGILESELHHFKGKRVRIFADNDGPGLKAEVRWWNQLENAGASVEDYSFKGLFRSEVKRSDGKPVKEPVKDLNDFALIDPDQWEAQRDAIEEAFLFHPLKAPQ